MQGIIECVCVSKGGLPKLPVDGARASLAGLEGDAQRNTRIHGGPGKALLLIATEDLRRLRERGFNAAPGSLGENLTVRGIDFRRIRPGQRFHAGGAVIEVTLRRRPCQQLEPLNSGRTGALQVWIEEEYGLGGFYARVLAPGWIRQGDMIALAGQIV